MRSIEGESGGWKVADSDPTREYEETLNKAKGMLRAVALARTLAPEKSVAQ